LEAHQEFVLNALLRGRLVIFLGSGASLCGRPRDQTWQPGLGLPSASELASHLTRGIEEGYSPDDLMEAASALSYYAGEQRLDVELRRVFDVDFPPSVLHACLARMPAWERSQNHEGAQIPILILTTNYDDLVERAFRLVEEAYDVVYYTKPRRGLGPPFWATRSRSNGDRPAGPVTTILKIHGTIDRSDPNLYNCVITEDDYIDYLEDEERILRQLPVEIQARLARSDILYLGYGLRDWNVILALRRFSDPYFRRRSWAIERPSSRGSFATHFLMARWKLRAGADVVFADLADYAAALSESMDA